MRTEPLGEDRTLAILKHRQKKHGDYEQCPVCFGFLSWEDHAECEEALSPTPVERIKPRDRKKEFIDFFEEGIDREVESMVQSHL